MGAGRRLNAFMQVSLDGRFADASDDMSFAHKQAADAEWHGSVLLSYARKEAA